MSLQENKALVRRFVEKVQNQHNLAEMNELFSPAFINHDNEAEPPGTEGVKGFFTMMFSAFPDMHFTIQQQLAEGNQVATHKTFFGTHLGTFMGIPPTGKQVTIDVIDIYTISEGKITDHWSVGDFLSMMQQLGVVPAPG